MARRAPLPLLPFILAAGIAGCDGDVKRAGAPPTAPPTIVERFVRYEVAGASGEALDRAITLGGHPGAGGKRFGGHTDCNLKYRYRPEMRERGCRVAEAICEAEIVYTLPRWADAGTADPGLRDRWTSFLAALETHERGHGRLCEEAAGEARAGILAVPEAPGCDGLRVAVERVFAEVLVRASRASDDYDVRTNHGATEGASPRVLYP